MSVIRFGMDGWRVVSRDDLPRDLAWSLLSRLSLNETLLRAIARDWLDHIGYQVLKSDRASLVETKRLKIGPQAVEVVTKAPWAGTGLKGWLRSYRPARVHRALDKTMRLHAIGVACEFPVLSMERRRRGRLVEQLFVAERVPGVTLASFELDAINEHARRDLLRDCGRAIARIEAEGWTHFDTKTSNWIVFEQSGRFVPVMIDCDGMRTYRWRGAGLERLVRALRQHPHHHPSDLEAVSEGYRC